MESSNGIVAVLFDIDSTLITTGGAGAVSWRMAFEDLYGIAADIDESADAGMTDPEVGRLTFKNVVGHEPSRRELAKIMSRRLHYLPGAVAQSPGYKVLPGVEQTLERLCAEGFLLGISTGGTEAAAHIKLARGGLNHFFCFGGYGSDSADRTELTRKALERAGTILGQPLEPREVIVVGDTPRDIHAAHGVGAVAVGVSTGHFSKDELRAAGADYVLGTLEQALPLSGLAAKTELT